MAFQPRIVNLDGLRVVLVKDDRQSVMVQSLIDAGSREETEKQAGSAHFLEHFVFKGTKKYPGVFDISGKVESVGGKYNAWTSHSDTGFWVKTAKEKLDLGLSLVGQMMSEPNLPQEYFDKERGTILQEYYMYEDQPQAKAWRAMWEKMLGRTNMGRQVIGTLKSLKEMKLDYLKEFMNTWYGAENMLVGVVGAYGDEKELLKNIRTEFAGVYLRKGKLPVRDVFRWGDQEKPKISLVKRKTDQAAVSMGIPGTELLSKYRYVRYLVNIILGGSSISRLFLEVREKRGWAYSVGSEVESFKDFGVVGVGGGFPTDKVHDAVSLIVEIMGGLGGKSKWEITQKDLEMAKECYTGRMSLKFDKPEQVLSMTMSSLIEEGKIYTPEHHIEQAKKVTMDQIKEYCHEIMDLKKVNIGILGDYKEVPVKL